MSDPRGGSLYPPEPKQPWAARLASSLDSWQKVVVAVTALIVALGALTAALGASGPRSPYPPGPTTGLFGPQDGPASTTDVLPPFSTSAPIFNGAPTQNSVAACQPAEAELTRYSQMAGSTPYSQFSAASHAAAQLESIITSYGPTGIIWHDLNALINDFQQMQAYTSGGTEENPGANTVNARITLDGQTLFTDCGNG